MHRNVIRVTPTGLSHYRRRHRLLLAVQDWVLSRSFP